MGPAAHPDNAPDIALGIMRAVLDAADPARALARAWPTDLLGDAPVRLLVVGKAAIPMAREALARLDASGPHPRLTEGLVITTPHPDAGSLPVETLVADHPLATESNLVAASRVEAFVSRTGAGERLLVLLSGGGSALLTSPAGALTLGDIRAATGSLLRAGSPIRELNAVRKHCERLKGGRLARLVGGAAPIVVMVVSDVLGDPLDVISSGPFAPDPSTYADALRVLEQRSPGFVGDDRAVMERLREHLIQGIRGGLDETPKPGDPALERVTTRIIASNQAAAVAARDAALAAGFTRVLVLCRVEGESALVGRDLVRRARAYRSEGPTPCCVVLAGETTVTVGRAVGVGGRNQELALAAAVEMAVPKADGMSMCVLALATDGIDGPTDAAGAIVTQRAARSVPQADLGDALARHDSHTLLGRLGWLVRTGPTGTNINDVAIAAAW